MPSRTERRWRRAGLVCLLAVTAACHRGPPPPVAPEAAYAEAMRNFRAGRFGRARERFQRLLFDLPGRDTLLPRLRFYLSESHAGLGELVTAAREFRRMADDFPADALAPYALLRAGDAYARLWKRPELDPSNGETAIATYQELTGRYPDTPAAQLGALRIRMLQDLFARKDLQSGVFYFRRGAYDSAILYFRSLIAKYPSSAVVPEAFVKLVQAYGAIGYAEEREETCSHLRQYYGTRADVREVCGDGRPGR